MCPVMEKYGSVLTSPWPAHRLQLLRQGVLASASISASWDVEGRRAQNMDATFKRQRALGTETLKKHINTIQTHLFRVVAFNLKHVCIERWSSLPALTLLKTSTSSFFVQVPHSVQRHPRQLVCMAQWWRKRSKRPPHTRCGCFVELESRSLALLMKTPLLSYLLSKVLGLPLQTPRSSQTTRVVWSFDSGKTFNSQSWLLEFVKESRLLVIWPCVEGAEKSVPQSVNETSHPTK